ncbi:WcaF family extracellular polysaccharide biosynthesis acetyltransferase [Yoonia sp. MH D7]
MKLDSYTNPEFSRGASKLTELAWIILGGMAVASWVPGSAWRIALLRIFGAQIGKGVVIKPRVIIKFPWKQIIGDHAWIGEAVWIDNLAPVTIGAHCCISQGAYLCTGSHDWTSPTFNLIVKPVTIGDSAWIGAQVKIAPDTTIGAGTVIQMGGLARGKLDSWTIYAGTPLRAIKTRILAKTHEN